jgi:hypothetical protein
MLIVVNTDLALRDVSMFSVWYFNSVKLIVPSCSSAFS